MSFRDTSSFGKRIEYKIISELLVQNFDVYVPLVDDHGIDCIVKSVDYVNDTYKEIQIKARSKYADEKSNGCFTVDKHEIRNNYYFIFYSEIVDKRWCLTSKQFIDETIPSKGKRTLGRRKIVLFTKTKSGYKLKDKFKKYIVNDYSIIRDLQHK